MTIERYVVDASVAAKWFLDDEELIEPAREFLLCFLGNKIKLHAPEIMKFEMAHLLTKAKRSKRSAIDSKLCREAYRIFLEYPIIFQELNDLALLEALAFANRFHRSFYDATYIVLAMELECRWITAEKKYADHLPRGFPKSKVMHLASFES